jgi:hypothetical protein
VLDDDAEPADRTDLLLVEVKLPTTKKSFSNVHRAAAHSKKGFFLIVV